MAKEQGPKNHESNITPLFDNVYPIRPKKTSRKSTKAIPSKILKPGILKTKTKATMKIVPETIKIASAEPKTLPSKSEPASKIFSGQVTQDLKQSLEALQRLESRIKFMLHDIEEFK